jgi:hypothetical protein
MLDLPLLTFMLILSNADLLADPLTDFPHASLLANLPYILVFC